MDESEGVQGVYAAGRDLATRAHVDDEQEAAARVEPEVPRQAQTTQAHLLNLARMHRILSDVEHREVAASRFPRVQPGPVAVYLRPGGEVAALVQLRAFEPQLPGRVVAVDHEPPDVRHARIDERQLRVADEALGPDLRLRLARATRPDRILERVRRPRRLRQAAVAADREGPDR